MWYGIFLIFMERKIVISVLGGVDLVVEFVVLMFVYNCDLRILVDYLIESNRVDYIFL